MKLTWLQVPYQQRFGRCQGSNLGPSGRVWSSTTPTSLRMGPGKLNMAGVSGEVRTLDFPRERFEPLGNLIRNYRRKFE